MAGHMKAAGAAFIVGGSGGLGRSICHALADEFEAVFFTYYSDRPAAEALARGLAGAAEIGYHRWM